MQATYFDFASTKISFFSSHWPNGLACFFSFFLPACLTSLTSHIHLCGLTFIHPFINVAGLLYIIIEEKMNPILLFRTSCFSKPISLCWLLCTCPTSSFNELRQIVGWNMVQRTQQSNAPNNLPLLPTLEEIFDLSLQLEFISDKSTLDSAFFIIFTNTEKISSKLITFIFK